MEEDVGLHNRSNASSLTVGWNSRTVDDGSKSGETTLRLGLHFETSGEEIRFVIAVSVYVLAWLLQIAIFVATRRSAMDRNHELDAPAATPLDRAIGRLQRLNETPRNFERAEHIEVPDPSDTEQMSTCTSFCISAAKILLLVGSVALCIHILPISDWVDAALEYIRASGSVGCVILAACYIPAALTGFAVSVLALSAGALYGPVDGTIVAVVGYNCGGLAGFLAGRYLVRDCVMDWVRSRRKALVALQVLGREGCLLVLVCRACPFVPYAPANYIFGLSDVGLLTFLVSSVVAATPYTFISVAVGATADNIAELKDTTPPRWLLFVLIVALIIVLVTALHLRRLGKQMLANADKKKERQRQWERGTPCEPLSARQQRAGSPGSARQCAAEEQADLVGSSSSHGSSPWLREVNPLNLSIASNTTDGQEDPTQLQNISGSASSKGDDGNGEAGMTPMEISNRAEASGGSDSVSVRLPTRDEDEDEDDLSLTAIQLP